MNLRQPYEQVIADKLRQLRPPDADASWQQMKRLLDEDEDKGAGGKRPPGNNNGWWRTGLLAIVLITSTWLFLEQKKPTNQLAVEKNIATKSVNVSQTNSEADNKKTQTKSIENNTTLTTTADNNNNAVADNNVATSPSTSNNAEEKNSDVVKDATAKNANAIVKNSSDLSSDAALNLNKSTDTKNTPAKLKAGSLDNTIAKNNSLLHHSSNSSATNDLSANTPLSIKKLSPAISHSNNNKHHQAQHTNRADIADINSQSNNTSLVGIGNIHLQEQKNKTGKKSGTGNKNLVTGNDVDAASTNGIDYIASNATISAKEKTWFERLTALRQPTETPSYNTDALADDSIASNKKIELSTDTKKAVAKAKRDNEIALLDKKDKKSLHLNLSNLFKPFSMRLDAEPWWAAGLAINGNIPLSSQNRFNYNMNAKSSTLTDYIPSPYLQFHLNNYVYFQTELNFVSPQFTPQLLAFKESSDVTAQSGVSEQKSIFIQKMYYFNWPVSLHYSPISNLYFSAGIQFSSFQSGLASIERKQYATTMGPDHASSVNTEVLKFKDDSIAAKIAPNEWRWQVGAEYYIDRFSVGMRYNQSFKNAVNAAATPVLAPTVFRNQSMLFFIRYNLFESRTKASVPKNQ